MVKALFGGSKKRASHGFGTTESGKRSSSTTTTTRHPAPLSQGIQCYLKSFILSATCLVFLPTLTSSAHLRLTTFPLCGVPSKVLQLSSIHGGHLKRGLSLGCQTLHQLQHHHIARGPSDPRCTALRSQEPLGETWLKHVGSLTQLTLELEEV